MHTNYHISYSFDVLNMVPLLYSKYLSCFSFIPLQSIVFKLVQGAWHCLALGCSTLMPGILEESLPNSNGPPLHENE